MGGSKAGRWEWRRPVNYQPVHPDAYVVRTTWVDGARRMAGFLLIAGGMGAVIVLHPSTSPSSRVVVPAVLAAMLAVPIGIIVRDVRAKAVPFAVDEPGVFLGDPSHSVDAGGEPELVPWAEIEQVVLFKGWQPSRGRSSGSWHRCVGVKRGREHIPTLFGGSDTEALRDPTTGRPLVPEQQELLAAMASPFVQRSSEFALMVTARAITGWSLDRAKLEAAVRRFAPSVPVVDAPRQRQMSGLASLSAARDSIRGVRSLVGRWRPPAIAAIPPAFPGAPVRAPRTAAARPSGTPGVGRSLGCLAKAIGTVLLVIVWLISLLPMGLIDDLVGEAMAVRWTLLPDADGKVTTTVEVPPQSRLYVEVEPVHSGRPGRQDSFVVFPAASCLARDGGGDWAPVPGPGPAFDRGPSSQRARRYQLATSTGTLTLACTTDSGRHTLFLWRDDPARKGLYTVAVFAARAAWLVLLTLVIWGPVVLVVRRRLRKARRALLHDP